MAAHTKGTPIERVDVSVYKIPTDSPESDGTFVWQATTLVLVEMNAGGRQGLGYTYADGATAALIQETLTPVISGTDAMDIPGAWDRMVGAVRNLGRTGVAALAISAMDVCLWDLKAKLFDVALSTLLGAARSDVPVYGSGGFTSYSVKQLQRQLAGWVEQGIPRVKMKIGRDAAADLARVRAARQAIGAAQLYVDANGAYRRKEALAQAQAFADEDVVWFEEPVPAADLVGLHLLRDRGPRGMDIAAGEYGFDLDYFRRMLEAEAVDVLQADASRCAGITGFLRAAALSEARHVPLSAHCAPSLHVAPCAAISLFHPIEYFHDHVRIEHMLFDGALTPVNGALTPDRARPGLGLTFKRADAAKFAV